MTPDGFRRVVLSMPGAVEASHMGHPDFRVAGKVFATIGWPDSKWAMVKLTPEQQAAFVAEAPEIFVPVAGGWGRSGSTNVRLATATKAKLEPAVTAAWINVSHRPPSRRSAPQAPKPRRTA